ncbi:MAG: hypothetical protein GC201_01140 [Alphaproteobacteria bacterium]|nr:hypothetical protein [Alphaproteobacteria bacterium]
MKALDTIPIWKTLKGLPQRLEALEARIAMLERAAKQPLDRSLECPKCGHNPVTVDKVTSDTPFAFAGAKNRHVTCPVCGHKDKLFYDPND